MGERPCSERTKLEREIQLLLLIERLQKSCVQLVFCIYLYVHTIDLGWETVVDKHKDGTQAHLVHLETVIEHT